MYQVTAISKLSGRRVVISFPMAKEDCRRIIGKWTGPLAQDPDSAAYSDFRLKPYKEDGQLRLFQDY